MTLSSYFLPALSSFLPNAEDAMKGCPPAATHAESLIRGNGVWRPKRSDTWSVRRRIITMAVVNNTLCLLDRQHTRRHKGIPGRSFWWAGRTWEGCLRLASERLCQLRIKVCIKCMSCSRYPPCVRGMLYSSWPISIPSLLPPMKTKCILARSVVRLSAQAQDETIQI